MTQPHSVLAAAHQKAAHNSDYYNKYNRHLQGSITPQRFDWINRTFNEDAVLISSFGVQSLLSIWHARNFAPDLDIVHLDIAGVEQDTARRYRDALADAYNFVPIILKVEREEDKDAVLEAYLRNGGVKAFIRGIRSDQTAARRDRAFIEPWGIYPSYTSAIAPVLDWETDRVERFLAQPHFKGLQHPDFKPGARSKGGRLLAENEAKTECSLEGRYRMMHVA